MPVAAYAGYPHICSHGLAARVMCCRWLELGDHPRLDIDTLASCAWHGTARWSRHTQVHHGSDVLPLLRLGAVTHQGWWSRLRRHKLCSLLHCSRLWRHVMRLSGESEATALGSSMRMCTHGPRPLAYRAPYGQAALLVSQPATQTCTQYGCVQRHGRPAS